MNYIDIIVPVKNEALAIGNLLKRIDAAMKVAGIEYRLIFVNDRSTDTTVFEIEKYAKKYPIKLHHKQGKPGKAFAILEGVQHAKGEFVAMLDADLQYPPEAIPAMLKKAAQHGIVVANRADYKSTFMRKLISRSNAFVFGRVLFGLHADVQSGLKLFRRDIVSHLDHSVISAWSLDIPLLFTALELGYSIGHVDITFDMRSHGSSKISLFKTAWEIATNALKLRLKEKRKYLLAPHNQGSMLGAGIVHKRKRFITHTTLSDHQSALVTFSPWQIFTISFIFGALLGGLILNPLQTGIIVVAILSTVYFLDVLFSFYLVIKSLHFPPEVQISAEEVLRLNSKILPIYSILCPLYKEAHVLPHFIASIEKLDWPKHRLDVLLLLEADDLQTIRAAKQLDLPSYVRIVVVPESQPKTKPKACNYGLAHAKGSYVVIYDAEDVPDPLQLKKAYLGFQKVGNDTFCLQAKLNYYNPHHNLLTRLFTAEYSLWFDVLLPGLQSIEATIPLGGTSNHFRTADLRTIHAWDPFNVTEDCDLGVRLFKLGYKTAIIDSTTLEEANGYFFSWLKQRSRWLKGYMQTYFVHMRQPFRFMRTHGIHSFIFQLVVGGKIAFMIINPILWALTIAYFALYAWVGPTIESLYPAQVFYMAAASLVFGNFMYLYNYMIGAAKRNHWTLVKFVFLVPFYWLMVSIAAGMAIVQLIFKPHYWEKTTHSIHLLKKLPVRSKGAAEKTADLLPQKPLSATASFWVRIRRYAISGGSALVAASMFANFFNYLYNAFLFRHISVEEFGLVTLMTSIITTAQIALSSLATTTAHHTARFFGKTGVRVATLWTYLVRKSILPSIGLCILWVGATPILASIFKADSILPFMLTTPVWLIGMASAINAGFVSGNLLFFTLAAIIVVEVLTKFMFTVAAVSAGYSQLVYLSIPISMCASFVTGWYVIRRIQDKAPNAQKQEIPRISKRFFASTLLSRVSTMAFFSVDMILVKLFLPPTEAGLYAFMSLVGKMVYFFGTLFTQFINPLVSRNEGAGKNSDATFNTVLQLTLVVSAVGYIGVGIFGPLTLPLLFPGKDLTQILALIPWYALGMAAYALTSAIVAYHQSKRQYLFTVINVVCVALTLGAILFFHQSVGVVSFVVTIGSLWSLSIIAALHILYERLLPALANVADFLDLFSAKKNTVAKSSGNVRILIFNWRDTKHVWAGGAEVYVQQVAKQWVSMGHSVTIFCGNDHQNPRNEVIDGVQVVRRGGFYTVYLWAFLYYVTKFRGNFDVVVDSQNGVPFFTPLYVGVSKFLLIHHVHQNVFRENLAWPLAQLALFIESKLMPFVYANQKVITVSESSKSDILAQKLSIESHIDIVRPGISSSQFKKYTKSSAPTFVYVGRLKQYKNIDVAIRSFKEVLSVHKNAKLFIAGEGESNTTLRQLTQDLGLEKAVNFLGKVSEPEKMRVLGSAWAAIQPSSFEGWGITVIEANAVGTPVIASAVNGLRDAVIHGKTGILVPVKNIQAFADAMLLLIARPSMRNVLSHAAYEWAREFSWEASAEKFLNNISGELMKEAKHTSKKLAILRH